MRVALIAFLLAVVPTLAFAQMEADQVDTSILVNAKPGTFHFSIASGGGVIGTRSSGSLLGIDSVVNWSSYFYVPGFFNDVVGAPLGPQFTWQYTMVGRTPFKTDEEQTTRIDAPIVPVIVDLRNFDGSPRFLNGHRLISDPSKYVQPVLNSPVFAQNFYSSSGSATQISDAIQRAEFFHVASSGWHTLLRPRVKQARTMALIRGTYRFAVNADGSCCAFILVDINTFFAALFPPTFTGNDTTTPVGQAETAGDIRTSDISTFLFPDTYLYFNGDPNQCCVLGFHNYDLEQGTRQNGFRERRYVLNYSSWISPGLFQTFQDITAVSHEIAETYNDPFGFNITPWWLAPNGNCQNSLETGDVIEGLPNSLYPITMNGFTYHPQNEALLEWFAGETPSSAISGAYSYPDTTVLNSASVSLTQNCTGVFAAAKVHR
jgi:hypothetical protein